jgi:hypothetical protein
MGYTAFIQPAYSTERFHMQDVVKNSSSLILYMCFHMFFLKEFIMDHIIF